MVAREDHAFVQYHRLAFAGLFHFGIARYAPGSSGGTVNVGIHQTEFQRRGRAENFFRASGITDTRQLNHNTVCATALYDRLPRRQLVNTVTQNINVLLNGVFARFAQARIGHYRAKLITALAGNHRSR